MPGEGPRRATADGAVARRRAVRIGLALLLSLAALGGSTLWGVQRLERDNSFCNSCHVGGRALHTDQYFQLTTGGGGTLAARHAGARVGAPPGHGMRCVDCHRGVSLGAKVRLQGTALADMLVHLAGRGVEPEALSYPMPDANCAACHAPIEGGRFHRIRAHAPGLPVRCTSCHPAHRPGPGPARTPPELLAEQCARCHPGLGEPVRRLAGGLSRRPDAGRP